MKVRSNKKAARGSIAVLLALGFVVTACGGAVAKTTPTVVATDVQADAASSKMVLIDVRDPDEFAAGHLPGATNIPYNDGSLEAQLATLDPTLHYGVYCHSGRRSGLSVALMKAAGFANVTDLGGFEAAAASTGLQPVMN